MTAWRQHEDDVVKFFGYRKIKGGAKMTEDLAKYKLTEDIEKKGKNGTKFQNSML